CKLSVVFLYVLGVIGILAGQSRVTRHVDAPCVSHILWSIIDDAGFVVSSVVSLHLALLSFHTLAGNLDRALPVPVPTNGTGSAKMWRAGTTGMGAGLAAHLLGPGGGS